MNKTLFEAVNEETVTDREQDTFNVLCHGRCHCGSPGTDEHTCPYSEEIHSDSTTMCNCCDQCVGQCAADI